MKNEKKSRSKFLKIVDEKHDINFHWPNNKVYQQYKNFHTDPLVENFLL